MCRPEPLRGTVASCYAAGRVIGYATLDMQCTEPPRVFETDYATVTEGERGLLDRSDRGKLALTGTDAKEFMQGQVTQDIVGLTPGHGGYAAFLTQKGKMLGDLRVLDAGDQLLLDTERVALQALFNMIRRYSLGYDVELHKRTLESGLLSLIGPLADELVERGGVTLRTAGEHDHADRPDPGGATRRGAIRTDVGVDLLLCESRRPGEPCGPL